MPKQLEKFEALLSESKATVQVRTKRLRTMLPVIGSSSRSRSYRASASRLRQLCRYAAEAESIEWLPLAQVFTERGFLTRVLMASFDLSKLAELDTQITKVLNDMGVSTTLTSANGLSLPMVMNKLEGSTKFNWLATGTLAPGRRLCKCRRCSAIPSSPQTTSSSCRSWQNSRTASKSPRAPVSAG